MRGLTEINILNSKAAVAKEQFLARAMNDPKGKSWIAQKPKLGGKIRIGLSQKPKDFYGPNL